MQTKYPRCLPSLPCPTSHDCRRTSCRGCRTTWRTFAAELSRRRKTAGTGILENRAKRIAGATRAVAIEATTRGLIGGSTAIATRTATKTGTRMRIAPGTNGRIETAIRGARMTALNSHGKRIQNRETKSIQKGKRLTGTATRKKNCQAQSPPVDPALLLMLH